MTILQGFFRNVFKSKASEKPSSVSTVEIETSLLQRYAGYEQTDIASLQSYCDQKAVVGGDHYLDGFGVRTLFPCVPFLDPSTLNINRLQLPIPDDGFHAEAIEYFSVVDAIERAESSKRFCAVELGAGWGPWIGMAGVVARRRNFNEIQLVGVEADNGRFELLRRHLAANGLRPYEQLGGDAVTDRVFTRLFRGVIWTYDGNAWFPIGDLADMGSAAVEKKATTDYRGMQTEHAEVSCKTLETLLEDLGVIDFVHIDVQGSEFDLISDRIEWIESNVRSLMVATHSRSIEGALIDLLYPLGWKLSREKPCRVDWNKENSSLTACTTVDGSQYWLNMNKELQH